MTTVSELKTMYVKLGGDLADVENIQTDAEMIDKIEDIMGSKILPDASEAKNGDVLTVDDGAWTVGTIPKELPTVTSEDNGDVLTVVEGEWANAEPAKELPTVTASDNGSVLSVVDGAWGKTPYKIKVIDFDATTDANGYVYKNTELINWKKTQGPGTNVVVLGARIMNEPEFYETHATYSKLWCEVTYDKFWDGSSVTNFSTSIVAIKCMSYAQGSESIIANTNVTVRVAYLEF